MSLVLAQAGEPLTGWIIGYAIAIVAVLIVAALVVQILILAHSIGKEAKDIHASLVRAVDNTAALKQLTTTNEAAEVIVEGLRRGRERLGG